MSYKKYAPPYYPLLIKLTVLASMITAVGIQYYSMISGKNLSHWIFPAMLTVTLLGMKVTAPRIPWLQLTLALITVFVTSAIIDALVLNLSPFFYILGNVLLPIICVAGFGSYWARKNYIPGWSNRW